jgi:uncharacterized membrane protein
MADTEGPPPNDDVDVGAQVADERHFDVFGRLRTYFLAGILVTAPVAITLYIAWQFIRALDNWVSPFIPPDWNPQRWGIPGFGVVIVVVGLTVIGAFTAGFLGRLLVRLSDSVMARMPVIRSLYAAIKQVFETVLAQKTNAFREVVLVEYPRKGVWTLGFITGVTGGEVGRCLDDQEMVNVFVPTTPNPTSGFLLFVSRQELRLLDMSVEDGIKMVVSTGIITPPTEPNRSKP